MAFSYVKLLNIQGFVCTDSGCVSATQPWKLREFLAEGYFVSGCDDTWAYLWNPIGTANSTDVCVCRLAGRLLPLSGMSDTFLNLGNPCRLSSETALLVVAVEGEERRRSLVVV